MGKHIHVVVNPAAGHDELIFNILKDVFYPAGVTWSASVTQAYGNDRASDSRKPEGDALFGLFDG